jgi:hypothetical protein
MEEIEPLRVGFGPVMRQRRQGWRELPDNGIHEAVAGWRQVVLARQDTHLAVNERNAQGWGLQGQAFDKLVQHQGCQIILKVPQNVESDTVDNHLFSISFK